MAELSRADKIVSIKLAILNALDNQIIDIYNLFIKSVKHKNNKELNRQTMCEHIMEKMYMVNDSTIFIFNLNGI